jgi:hypothetical protein
MSGHAGEMALAGPASVAVHDNGDVLWESLGIELPVYCGFSFVQSGGDFREQGKPFRFRN